MDRGPVVAGTRLAGTSRLLGRRIGHQYNVDKQMDRRLHADRPAPVMGKLFRRDGTLPERMALVLNREVGSRQMLEPDDAPKAYGREMANHDRRVHVLRPAMPTREVPGTEFGILAADLGNGAQWPLPAIRSGTETTPRPVIRVARGDHCELPGRPTCRRCSHGRFSEV